MINPRAFREWYRDPSNKEDFDTIVIPLVCEANGRIIGGPKNYMYKPWAFALMRSWNEAGVDDQLIGWEPIPDGEPNAGDPFPVYDWHRFEFVVGHLVRFYVKHQ